MQRKETERGPPRKTTPADRSNVKCSDLKAYLTPTPLTAVMSSADVKIVSPLLLKISALIVPTDDCARTVGTNAIAKVNLPLKLKLLIGALRYIFTFLRPFYFTSGLRNQLFF